MRHRWQQERQKKVVVEVISDIEVNYWLPSGASWSSMDVSAWSDWGASTDDEWEAEDDEPVNDEDKEAGEAERLAKTTTCPLPYSLSVRTVQRR